MLLTVFAERDYPQHFAESCENLNTHIINYFILNRVKHP